MNISEAIQKSLLFFDGGMGTLLQKRGLKPGELPEMWNITHPDVITDIHKSYFDSGSNVVTTNTFGANCLKFNDSELEPSQNCRIRKWYVTERKAERN